MPLSGSENDHAALAAPALRESALRESAQPSSGSAGEVFWVFLRLGVTAFGGPVAHIAAMEDEIVRRRQWVSGEEFLDLLSAANVIPGPNSTELAIHLGYRRAGIRGLVAAGLAFIVPATLLVWLMAIGYTRYGQRPEVGTMLAGMQPVVLAVVTHALWRLRNHVMRSPLHVAITVSGALAVLAGVHELVVLAGAAAVGLLLAAGGRGTPSQLPVLLSASALKRSGAAALTTLAVAAAPTVATVFTSFLKIGSVLFGSGYVLLAFLRAEFVVRHGWLTEGQLLDAIAVGQITPGPVFTSATFVGYLLAGHMGAVAATVGIFLPAFVFVAVSGPLLRQVRQSPRLSAALDTVNAASLALMAAVVVSMLRPIASSVSALVIFLGAAVLLMTSRIGAGWLLLGGGILGLFRMLLAL